MMATRKRLATWVAVLLAVVLVAGAVFLVRQIFFGPKTITAYFPTATAIYPGDEVRVSGVKVGRIESIQPEGTQTKLVLEVDRDVPVPAGAKAVIVAQNLIAARYVQLTPAYREGDGPTMVDGAVIPSDRTAVPVEWDEVKTQLTRLATELGPKPGSQGAITDTSVGRFIDSAANAMDGNGEKLRSTLAELSGVARIFAEGSGNIVDIIKNLQVFVGALRDSKQQIVLFQNRLASLTSVVDNSRSDLDAALSDLSVAIGEVQRFVAGSREQTSEQIRSLASVTQTLVDSRLPLENVLHVAPNAIANYLNIYYPPTGGVSGAFSFVNFSNPVYFICGMIGGVANTTAPETAKLCEQYLGPALRLLNFNNLPLPINPYLRPSPKPENLIYTDPKLAPGGTGPGDPPEPRPAVSAYTGTGDVPPPPGYGGVGLPEMPQGLYGHDEVPATPSPALFPGAPIPGPPNIQPGPGTPSVQNMLLPPTPPAPPPPGPLLPAEGLPPS
ncbi:virulence factor Mce family protein [Mycolicibacterium rhodesiae NBB3]|uniref:Virulence factor Mce family protein n=1 Tax=Mycolicibacterium rhodesiae (strain NBB3) TaxID=710685 RepID=G8RH65_MYCRN|nr:MCE family protein [Mycolicibacterium rhodesiae]AEV74545.1 virulence factor Mce family protein [Mycolicibacterium rhodesiae NBB3]